MLNAAQTTWTGLSTTNNFGDAGNWSSGVPTSAADNQIIFDGSTRLTPNNDFATPYTVNSITFAAGAGAFTLSGNALTTGGVAPTITNNSSYTQIINNNVTFGVPASGIIACTVAGNKDVTFGGTVTFGVLNNLTFTNNNTATVTFGNVVLSNNTTVNRVIFGGNGSTVINGTVSSGAAAGGIINHGVGTLTLNGDNSGLRGVSTAIATGNAYVETMRLSLGTSNATGLLNIGNDNALGSGYVTMNGQYGTIAASGGSRTVANNLVSYSANASTLLVTGTNDLTWGGTITRDVNGLNNLTINSNNQGVTTFKGNYYIAAASGNSARTSGTAIFGGSGRIVYEGSIQNGNTGNHGLLYNGTGSLKLAGNNTYTGATTLTSGTVIISSDSNLNGTSSALNFNGGTLQIDGNSLTSLNTGRTTTFASGANVGFGIADSSNSFTVSQNLNQGAGGLIKSGAGALILTGNNSYTGVSTVNAGTLHFATSASLGGGNAANWIASKINVKSGGTLAFNVGGSGEFSTGNVSTLLTNLSASISGSNGMNAGANLGFDTTNAGGSFTIADTIADTTGAAGGARGLTKLGTGSLILSSVNTYSGQTKVTDGKLVISGSLSNSAVTVAGDSATTLAGSGLVAKDVTVSLGGRIAPGLNSEGTNQGAVGETIRLATAGILTLSDAHLDFDLASTAGGVSDKIFTGELVLGSNLEFTFNELSEGQLQTGVNYTLINFTGISGFNADNIATTFIGGDYTATYSVVGNDLAVQFTTVPEPGTWAMLVGGLGMLIFRQQLRRRSA